MLAFIVTFFAGVFSVIFSRSLFRFIPTSKAAAPSTSGPSASEAMSAASAVDSPPERAMNTCTISLTADATTDSKAASPAVPSLAARSLAQQSSMNRSRAAIQVLNEAADLLRAQGDLLVAASDDAPASPEPQDPQATAVAVQRFLSRKLSRQASHMSSSSANLQREAVEVVVAGLADVATGTDAGTGTGPLGGDGGAADVEVGRGGATASAAGPVAEAFVLDGEVDSARLDGWSGYLAT